MLSCLVFRKLHNFSQFTLLQCLFPQPNTNVSISSGFDEGLPCEKRNVLWLVSCSQCVVIGEQLRRCFSTAPPLAKTASSSILPYQFRPREYWARGSCRNFACTDIARHIKVVMLLLMFLAKARFRCQQQLNNNCTDYVQINAMVICIMLIVLSF